MKKTTILTIGSVVVFVPLFLLNSNQRCAAD